MTTPTTRLADLRRRLAQTAVAARNAREDLATARAQAEARAIERLASETGLTGEKALGSNAESRERALLLALASDETYQSQLAAVRALEATQASLEADLEAERDIRREVEWSIRLRLAAALDGRGIQSESSDQGIADDSAFEDAVDHVGVETVADQSRANAHANGGEIHDLRDLYREDHEDDSPF